MRKTPDRSAVARDGAGRSAEATGQSTWVPDPLRRALGWAGDDLSPGLRTAQLQSLHIALLMSLSFELTIHVAYPLGVVSDLTGAFGRQPFSVVDIVMPLAIGLCLLALLLSRDGRARRRSGWAAFAVMAAIALTLLPNTPNHYLMLTLALGFLALLDQRDAAEQQVALQAIRWLFVIVLFGSGVQKILYGLYFHGEFFAYRIATDPTFAASFAWLMPAAELERLQSFGDLAVGVGPFRSTWWPLAVLSNATYVIEMVLPVFLLWRRTRPAAIVLTILFFLGMEVAPREIFFGAIAVQMVLLFGRRDWNGLLMPFWVLLFIALTLMRKFIPGIEFA